MKFEIKPKAENVREGSLIISKQRTGKYLVIVDRDSAKYGLVCLTSSEMLMTKKTSIKELLDYYFKNEGYTVYSPNQLTLKLEDE